MLITIAICTYNRASLLARCLDSVCSSSSGCDDVEIMVVDNNSSDNTKQVVERYATQVAYVHEARQGLSHARNTAVDRAAGTFIAFIDDDCRLPAEWVPKAISVATDKGPDLFGGPIRACYESPKPAWYKDEYGSYVQGSEAGPLPEGTQFHGNNVVFKRSLLQGGSGFRPDLGMHGDHIGYGEETELMMRLSGSGLAKNIYYDPRLSLHHLVRDTKMTMSWYVRDAWMDGLYARKIFGRYKNSGGPLSVLSMLAQNAGALLAEPFRIAARNRRRFPYWQNYVIERTVDRIRTIAYCYADLRGGRWSR